MINADVLTFQEVAMDKALSLSRIHQAVLEFLQGREDVVLFGAQAVNAYASEPRTTQEVIYFRFGQRSSRKNCANI